VLRNLAILVFASVGLSACGLYGDPYIDAGVLNARADDVLVVFTDKLDDGTQGQTAYLVPANSKGDVTHGPTGTPTQVVVYRASDCAVLGQAITRLSGLLITVPESGPIQFETKKLHYEQKGDHLPSQRETCSTYQGVPN
jgi:hypothetical protein